MALKAIPQQEFHLSVSNNGSIVGLSKCRAAQGEYFGWQWPLSVHI